MAVTPGDTAGDQAIAALERGGILELFPIKGLPRGYEVLRVLR
jgi:hypothetical protein